MAGLDQRPRAVADHFSQAGGQLSANDAGARQNLPGTRRLSVVEQAA